MGKMVEICFYLKLTLWELESQAFESQDNIKIENI